MNQSKLEANTCSWHEARENVRERVMIGFGCTLDWLRKWREILKPITKRSNVKPKQTQFTFDTQVKTALYKPTNYDVLTIFRRLPNIFRKLPKFSEDYRRLQRKIRKCFDIISIKFGSLSIKTWQTLRADWSKMISHMSGYHFYPHM